MSARCSPSCVANAGFPRTRIAPTWTAASWNGELPSASAASRRAGDRGAICAGPWTAPGLAGRHELLALRGFSQRRSVSYRRRLRDAVPVELQRLAGQRRVALDEVGGLLR